MTKSLPFQCIVPARNTGLDANPPVSRIEEPRVLEPERDQRGQVRFLLRRHAEHAPVEARLLDRRAQALVHADGALLVAPLAARQELLDAGGLAGVRRAGSVREARASVVRAAIGRRVHRRRSLGRARPRSRFAGCAPARRDALSEPAPAQLRLHERSRHSCRPVALGDQDQPAALGRVGLAVGAAPHLPHLEPVAREQRGQLGASVGAQVELLRDLSATGADRSGSGGEITRERSRSSDASSIEQRTVVALVPGALLRMGEQPVAVHHVEQEAAAGHERARHVGDHPLVLPIREVAERGEVRVRRASNSRS